ncbi:hypothetical protein E4N94_12400 [Treponema denticola]|uniref:hypothetical protein n=1 Tax=Treponema denticola TaxID=158 RepID=UPI003D8C8B84
MKMNKIMIVLYFSMFCFGCQNIGIVRMKILPELDNNFMCDLINLYAKSYDKETGNIVISKEKLINLELQMKTFIETNLANIKNYYVCKKEGRNYLYTYFEITNGELNLKQEERYYLIWEPQNPNAIKTGQQVGYVKEPALNVEHELALLVNNYSFYKEFGMALMQKDKSFFIDVDKYSFLINYYLKVFRIESEVSDYYSISFPN